MTIRVDQILNLRRVGANVLSRLVDLSAVEDEEQLVSLHLPLHHAGELPTHTPHLHTIGNKLVDKRHPLHKDGYMMDDHKLGDVNDGDGVPTATPQPVLPYKYHALCRLAALVELEDERMGPVFRLRAVLLVVAFDGARLRDELGIANCSVRSGLRGDTLPGEDTECAVG